MTEPFEFAATPGRLDQAVAQHAGVSRAQVQAWIASGAVWVDACVASKASQRLRGQEHVRVVPPAPLASHVLPEDVPLSILFEDAHLIAIDKPAGMVTHPAPGVVSGTLVNALLGRGPLALLGEDFGPEGHRPGIVHRLDKDTSGVIVVAKTREAQAKLALAFQARETSKHYLAITVGVLPQDTTLEAAIGRHPQAKVRMAVNGLAAKTARSHFAPLAVAPSQAPTHALVKAQIFTGRTHQIRVHLQHLGTPVLGDAVYGKPSPMMPRQALHALMLGFKHPITGQDMVLRAEPPADMLQAWLGLGGVWPKV